MQTGEILAKLKSMAKKAGESIFERATMVSQVLEDKQWIEVEFSGNYENAVKVLEADCFPELSVAFSLNELLELVRTFKTKDEWAKHKFNLSRLWAEYEGIKEKAKGDKPKFTQRRAKVEDIVQREEVIEKLKVENTEVKEVAKTLAVERNNAKVELEKKESKIKVLESVCKRTETEVERLRRENAELQVQVEELRSENAQLMEKIERLKSKQGSHRKEMAIA